MKESGMGLSRSSGVYSVLDASVQSERDRSSADVQGEAKHLFVEALTEIAALPLDSISMEIRRLLVVLNHQAIVEDTIQETPLLHVRNIIAALNARDVLLKV
ncbi:hypothetical protein PsorP6_013112 [Peronosclerospora sorghi]|uniref:Uncharacterized protein n=1 Tax=Peronosclerospora sorghi TaxID=230839 RepID=A0ACC0WEI0_9STRA|nr:hypothetical protein PsorP6_013112 [Peronosclerospora sorghi]